ncbi:MAG: hypothetical protein AAF708_13330 [Deinococcota bacterium]
MSDPKQLARVMMIGATGVLVLATIGFRQDTWLNSVIQTIVIIGYGSFISVPGLLLLLFYTILAFRKRQVLSKERRQAFSSFWLMSALYNLAILLWFIVGTGLDRSGARNINALREMIQSPLEDEWNIIYPIFAFWVFFASIVSMIAFRASLRQQANA